MFDCICLVIIIVIVVIIIVAISGINKNTKKIAEIQSQPHTIIKQHDRYCPKCGRAIPFDAKICPYCKLDFEK